MTRSSNVCFRFAIHTLSKTFLSEVNKSVPFNNFRAPNKLNECFLEPPFSYMGNEKNTTCIIYSSKVNHV